MKKLKVMVIFLLLITHVVTVFADEEKYEIDSLINVETEKNAKYELPDDKSKSINDYNSRYGFFNLNASVEESSSENNFVSYYVSDGRASIDFILNNYINASEENWHIANESLKSIGEVKLDKRIGMGVIVVQTSKDGEHWNNAKILENAFSKDESTVHNVYELNQVELNNGTYFRVIVAYRLEKLSNSHQFLVIKNNEYEYEKVSIISSFYIQDLNSMKKKTSGQRFRLTNSDDKRNTGNKPNGYSNGKEVVNGDPHFGWELGYFAISGYTSKVSNPDPNEFFNAPVFLKNVGDDLALSFVLEQDIDSLNNDPKLAIDSDGKASDQGLEIKDLNFGKGALFIQYTDETGTKHEPVKYLNFLSANAVPSADTNVGLYQEGDYEVVLDYKIRSDKLIDEINYYKLAFKFSVRNGNSMVYPRDLATGSELSNGSVTNAGFKLDLANSKYLEVSIRKEVLRNTNDGLVEDTRFNKTAKDGNEYADEGIYTITVKNKYTGIVTNKRIYVGSNPVMTAYMYTGMDIEEINELIQSGAEFKEDGTISMPEVSSDNEKVSNATSTIDEENNLTDNSEHDLILSNEKSIFPIVVGISAGVLLGVLVLLFKIKKDRKKRKDLEKRLTQKVVSEEQIPYEEEKHE